MKSLFMSLAFLIVSLSTYSQKQKTPEYSKDFYLKKSKTQKKIANIILFTATATIITGAVYPRGEEKEVFWCIGFCEKYENSELKVNIVSAGILLLIPSFTLYLASYRNGKKAESAVSINFENRENQLHQMPGGPQPTLSLRLAL